jgi:hypothetical protein
MSRIKPMSTLSQPVDANLSEPYQSEKKIIADVQGNKLLSMLHSLQNNLS